MSDPIIHIKDFTKAFGDNLVLKGINLTINKGEIFGIIGMSGSGKTTLLNSLIGFLQPDSGSVYFKSGHKFRQVHENQLEVNKLFGFASQEPSVYQKLTVEENLDHFGSLYDLPDDLRSSNIRRLLKLTNLTESRTTLAQNLSGGMQKRLSIACSLIHNPKILILDEPTADLDPILRDQTWDLIKIVNKAGTTVIVASHFLDEVERGCNKIAILHNTGVLTTGSPSDVKNSYTDNYEIRIETVEKRYNLILKKLKDYPQHDIKRTQVKDGQLVIYTTNADEILHCLIHIIEWAKETVVNIDMKKPSLTEVFEALTNEKNN